MKTRILFIYLQLFLFYSLTACLYAQTDDIKKGTFYETGGKKFEIITSDAAYQFELSYDETNKEYKIELIKPKDKEQPKKNASFINFDNNSINNAIKELKTNLDEKSRNELVIKILSDQKEYEKNKIVKNLEEQLAKEKRDIGKISFRKSIKELYVPVYNYQYSYENGKYNQVGCLKVENTQIAFGDGVISKINVNGLFYKYKEGDKKVDNKKNKKDNNLENNDPKEKLDKNELLDTSKYSQEMRKITFYNFLPPIPIRTREQIDYFNTCDGVERYWLNAQSQSTDGETDEFIYFVYLSDILYYEQNLIYNYGVYIPPDGKVIDLNSSVEVFDLKKESFINDFDLRLYTDVTALSADNPNGLIKFMGNYNFKLNTPRLKTDLEDKSNHQFIWINYMNIFFNFNKLENDKLIPPIKIANKQLYSTSFDLYRYSKFELGMDFNLMKLQTESISYCFNLLMGCYHTPIDSSFTNKTDTITISNGVNSFYFGSKLNIKFQANQYVDFNLGYSFIIPQLFSDRKLKEICKSINDDNFLTNNRGTYFNFNSWIHNIRAEFSIYPDPQDKSSFVFLKSGLVFNSSDNYITLMLGYSFPFSSLISIGQSVK